MAWIAALCSLSVMEASQCAENCISHIVNIDLDRGVGLLVLGVEEAEVATEIDQGGALVVQLEFDAPDRARPFAAAVEKSSTVTSESAAVWSRVRREQARFVQEYLIDLNAAQAAIRAGYSAKTARVIGHENLTRPDIAAAIEKAMAERAERTELTADWVVDELRKIAGANMADYMKSTLDDDPYLAIAAAATARARSRRPVSQSAKALLFSIAVYTRVSHCKLLISTDYFSPSPSGRISYRVFGTYALGSPGFSGPSLDLTALPQRG